MKKQFPSPFPKMNIGRRAEFSHIFLCIFFLWGFLFPGLSVAADSTAYVVEIPELPDNMDNLLRSVSDCTALRDSPPDTVGLLRRRMDKDRENFINALKSRGHFKSEVQASLETATTPYVIRFHIDPGPRFTFDTPSLDLEPSDAHLQQLLRPMLERIKNGDGYQASLIPDVESAMLDELRKNGYPSPVTGARRVIADHADNRVQVRFHIETGRRANFARTHIDGLERLSEEFVQRHIAWQEGLPFDIRKVDDTRAELIRTGLFRSVRIETKHSEDADIVDMHLTLLEAPRRTVRAGLWYYSDLGLGAGTGWTHRNLFGGGQELHLDANISEKLYGAGASLMLPNMGHPDRTLGLQAKYESEDTDSYDSVNLSLSSLMRRKLSEHLQLGYGLGYRASEVEKEDTREFHFLSVPLVAEYTTVTDPLDPSSGLALSALMEPFINLESQDSGFISWNLAARCYLPLRKDNSLILATRGRFSMLAGADRADIPEDMLLYAGGGGSVRGYAYQYAGDLDHDDKPLGGLSAVDFSTELRLRFSENFGFVLFGDGGGAFSERNPIDASEFFWGAGAGIRYYTPIGPIRLDVATPLNRRDDVDDSLQFYISLGQAF